MGLFYSSYSTAPTSIKYPNPYPDASTAPATADAGLVSGAMGQAGSANTAGSVAKVDASLGQSQAANTYTADQGTASRWNVDGNQTVSGQINKVIAADSPLMQQAATGAAQAANQRGLINSSMAVQAGQAALYDKAMPIAQADAQTHGQAAKSNQDAENSFSQFNTNAKNTASQFGAGARNALQSQQMDTAAKVALTNAGAANDAAGRDAQLNTQTGLAKLDAGMKVALQGADAAGKIQMTQLDANARAQLAGIDATSRSQIAGIEAQYKTQMQTSQSMASSYQSMIDNVTRILADKDLDAGAKQAAINSQTKLYNNAMQIQSQITGLNIGALLIGDGALAAPASAPTQEPIMAPAPGSTYGYNPFSDR